MTKRAIDLIASILGGLLLLPVGLITALLIRLESKGPAIYRQRRTGINGSEFTLLKFRSMRADAEAGGAQFTEENDPRITRLGRFMRKTRIDELPQLMNILKGEMSLIGPRPERPELEHELEMSIPQYRKRHWMRPGLSGWAQVCAPYASSIDDSDLKLSYDLYYLRHFSTWLDLVILFRTIKTVLKAGGR